MTTQKPDVEEIILASVQKDPADRLAFLEETCADNDVRTRVEALLKAHDSAGTFLEVPAIQPARVRIRHRAPSFREESSLDLLNRHSKHERVMPP